MTKRVVIIGAGPAGLTTSCALRTRGVEFITLERADTAGGVARTVKRDGWLAECGPHSFRFKENKTPAVLVESGLSERLVDASPAAKKRFITKNGAPVTAPWSALGPLGSLRMLFEPFAGKSAKEDESVADFFRRRLGVRAYERLGDAFVGGIHAGNPEELGIAQAFPELRRYEHVHGSILGGMLATRAERRTDGRARIATFRDGMSEFSETLAANLGDSLHTGATVTGIEKTGGGLRVSWTRRDGASRVESADAVVVATPSHTWSGLGLPAGAASLIKDNATPAYPPVAVVTLGFDRRHVAHPLDGFGLLTPSCENRVSLGILFPSSVFPGRAPKDGVSLAVFIGGARRPELARLPHEDLVALARRECEILLGATGVPAFVNVSVWRHAIPQYSLSGHAAFLKTLGETERAMPGLHFTGNFRGGVSLTATLDNAHALAESLSS